MFNLFKKNERIYLGTHNVYPEILIPEDGKSYTAKLISREGTAVEEFVGQCKDRKQGIAKATKIIQVVARKYLKKAGE